MFLQSDIELTVASQLLYRRLTRPANIDTTILNHVEADSISNFKEVYGRFVGFFVKRPFDNACFVLLGREHPLEDVTHIYVYYLDSAYDSIQPSECQKVLSKLPSDVF